MTNLTISLRLFFAFACLIICGTSTSLISEAPIIVPESDADALVEESERIRSAFGNEAGGSDGNSLHVEASMSMSYMYAEAGLAQEVSKTKPEVTKLASTESLEAKNGKKVGRVLLGGKKFMKKMKEPIHHKFNCEDLKSEIIEKNLKPSDAHHTWTDPHSKVVFQVPSKAELCVNGLGCVAARWKNFHRGGFIANQVVKIIGEKTTPAGETLYPNRKKHVPGIYPLASPRMAISSDGKCSAKLAFRRFTTAPNLPSTTKKKGLMQMSSFVIEASVCNTKSLKCVTKKSMLACFVRFVTKARRGVEMMQSRYGYRRRRRSRSRYTRKQDGGYLNCPSAFKIMTVQ